MFPYFSSRHVDQELLSCWLDDLGLSCRFHLDAFCLIQRYSFVDKVSWVNAVFSRYCNWPPFYVKLDDRYVLHWVTIHEWYSKYKSFWRVTKSIGSHLYMLRSINIDKQILAFDLKNNCCWELTQMLFGHGRGQMEIMNNLSSDKTLVLMGGCGGGGSKHVVEEYHFEGHKWRRLANMTGRRYCFASAVVANNTVHQNHIVVAGGRDIFGWGALTTVEMYCKETNKWTSLQDLPIGKSRVFATIHKQKLIVGPGTTPETAEQIDQFDFHKQEWSIVERNFDWHSTGLTYHAVGTTGSDKTREFYGCRLVVTDDKYAHLYDEKNNEWTRKKLWGGSKHMLFCL